MPIYIIPKKTSDAPETEALLQKAGHPLYTPETLYDYVRLTDFADTQFFSLHDTLFTKLMRNISDLTPENEFPKVLFGVPGYSASPRFTSESAAIVGDEWRSLEPNLIKSGLTSGTTEEAQDRSQAERKGLNSNSDEQTTRVAHKLSRLVPDSTAGKKEDERPTKEETPFSALNDEVDDSQNIAGE